jgi:hypothetical protein
MYMMHGSVNWIHVVQKRDQLRVLLNTAMVLQSPGAANSFLTSPATISFTLLHGVASV